MNKNSQYARDELEKKTGVNFTVLSALPYIDLIHMTVFDILHNILLGSCKRIWKQWTKKSDPLIISKSTLKIIEDRLKNIIIPNDVSRGFERFDGKVSRMVGHDLKIWTIITSKYVLEGLLPEEQYEMWLTFRQLTILATKRFIELREINQVKQLSIDFVNKYEGLFGETAVTPNMHFHKHIHEDIINYGPGPVYWTFRLEQMTGIVAGLRNNGHHPERTFMNSFHKIQRLLQYPLTNNLELSDAKVKLLDVFTKEETDPISDLLSDKESTLKAWDAHTMSGHARGDEFIPYRINVFKTGIRLFEAQKKHIMNCLNENLKPFHLELVQLHNKLKSYSSKIELFHDRLTTTQYKSQDASYVLVSFEDEKKVIWDHPGQLQCFMEIEGVTRDQNGKESQRLFIVAKIKWFRGVVGIDNE